MNWALMLTYGCLDYTMQSLADLLAQDVSMHVLVIVNKPPYSDPTSTYLASLSDPRVVSVVRNDNLGVAGGWNYGLRSIFEMYPEVQEVLVTGNDARLRRDTYRRLAAAPLHSAGCVFTAHTPSLEAMLLDQCTHPLTTPTWDGKTNDIGPAHMMRRWLFEGLGGYDEKFYPIYWEDVDFARRATLKYGGALVTYPVPCWHSDGGSRWYKVSPEVDESHHALFIKCRERYERKWGGLPPNEKFTVPFNGRGEE